MLLRPRATPVAARPPHRAAATIRSSASHGRTRGHPVFLRYATCTR
ncbi:hypothetical protein CZ774_01980 [Frigoribacterium sp. JB110]|nr:hypothetical protein CZ774_01980 [Frigoribacterium sp. JB110]